ncbi:MAG: hypothetical protein ACRDM8_06525 [Gaiellaceae bacterium]
MHVYIGDSALLPNLQDFLRRAQCVAEQRRAHELEVHLPDVRSEQQARRELDIYLPTWQAMNPGTDANILESRPAPA